MTVSSFLLNLTTGAVGAFCVWRHVGRCAAVSTAAAAAAAAVAAERVQPVVCSWASALLDASGTEELSRCSDVVGLYGGVV